MWTKEQISFLINNFSKNTHFELANILNKTTSSIQHKCIRLGLFKSRHITKHTYFDVWSPNMSYILGFITADGYINDRKEQARLAIEIHKKDLPVIEFIKEEICPTANIKFRKRTNGFSTTNTETSTIRVSSRKIINSLLKLGLTSNKTGNEILPNVPEKYKADYLRGLFDGDGSIAIWDKHRRFNIVSANKSFINDIRAQLGFNYGSISKKTINNRKPIYYWEVQNRKEIASLANYMYYKDHPFALERKRLKMLAIAREYEDKTQSWTKL